MKHAYLEFIETPILSFGRPITIREKPKKVRHINVRQFGLSTGRVIIVRKGTKE